MSFDFNKTNHIQGNYTRPLTEEELEKAQDQMRKFKASLLQNKNNPDELIYQCSCCKIVVIAVNMKPIFQLCPVCAEHVN